MYVSTEKTEWEIARYPYEGGVLFCFLNSVFDRYIFTGINEFSGLAVVVDIVI